MKKIILLCLSLFIFVSYADAQSGTVRRIVDAIEGSDGTCYTTDGERGTLLPNSSSRRTESTSSYSSSRTRANSSTVGASVSASAEVGTRNTGASVTGALTGSATRSNSSTNSETNSSGNSRDVNYICVPDSKRWK